MKRGYLEILFFCAFFKAGCIVGQNLVPNPSFEDTIECPTCITANNCVAVSTKYWFNPSTQTNASPDYFHACWWQKNLDPNGIGIPFNFPGYQIAHSGDAYIGLISFETINFREYIETQLTKPLEAGKKYNISLFASASNDLALYVVRTLGVHFSKAKITSTNELNLPVTPQVLLAKDDGLHLTDTLNWMKISGSFVANGGEEYITIGNFENDANSDTMHFFGNSYISYYFLDDVSVIKEPENNIFIPNVFSPNGDGKNDILFVLGNNLKSMVFTVFNRWGEKVFESQDINKGWDGTYNNDRFSTDVFYYYLTGTYTDDKPFVQRGNVTLMR